MLECLCRGGSCPLACARHPGTDRPVVVVAGRLATRAAGHKRRPETAKRRVSQQHRWPRRCVDSPKAWRGCASCYPDGWRFLCWKGLVAKLQLERLHFRQLASGQWHQLALHLCSHTSAVCRARTDGNASSNHSSCSAAALSSTANMKNMLHAANCNFLDGRDRAFCTRGIVAFLSVS